MFDNAACNLVEVPDIFLRLPAIMDLLPSFATYAAASSFVSLYILMSVACARLKTLAISGPGHQGGYANICVLSSLARASQSERIYTLVVQNTAILWLGISETIVHKFKSGRFYVPACLLRKPWLAE